MTARWKRRSELWWRGGREIGQRARGTAAWRSRDGAHRSTTARVQRHLPADQGQLEMTLIPNLYHHIGDVAGCREKWRCAICFFTRSCYFFFTTKESSLN